MLLLSPASTVSLISAVVTNGALSPFSLELGMRCENPDGEKGRTACLKFKDIGFLRTLVPPFMAAFVALSPIYFSPVSLGLPADVQRGGTLFRRACIGCHDAGGNLIQPGATLFTEDLQRNGLDSDEEIYRVTYFGKGRMPGFGETCSPRGQCTFGPRLSEEEIKLLAEYVKMQADQGWPNSPSLQD